MRARTCLVNRAAPAGRVNHDIQMTVVCVIKRETKHTHLTTVLRGSSTSFLSIVQKFARHCERVKR